MLPLTLLRMLGAKRRPAPASPPPSTRPARGDHRAAGADVIFRMKSWPQLPESGRTAEIYQMLSVMSSQPVNRRWLLHRCRMAPKDLDKLLVQLVREGALEVIDPASYADRDPARA